MFWGLTACRMAVGSSSSSSSAAVIIASAASRLPISFQSLSISDELSDAPLELLEGALPPWLRGTLFRNGPGAFDVGDERLYHLFDGYAMMTKIKLSGEGVPRFSNRFVRSDAFEGLRNGEQLFAEFGTPRRRPTNALELVRSLFELIFAAPTDNASVNTVRLADGTRLALTETRRGSFVINGADLSTERRFEWTGAATGQLNTAHPMRTPDGGFVNVGTDVGSAFCSYHVYRTRPATPEVREIIASIPCARRAAPCWLHSFGLTATRAVVIEQPTPYDLPSMLGMAKAAYTCLQWRPGDGVRIHLVDLDTGAVETRRVADPFFFFHIANAFDAKGGGVSLDLALYDDPSIVEALRLQRLSAPAGDPVEDLPRSRLTRLHIPADATAAITRTPLDDVRSTGGFVDFPVTNPRVTADAAYQFVWAIAADRPTRVANKLIKIELRAEPPPSPSRAADGEGGRAGGARTHCFAEPNCFPSEPVFVPRPGATSEDDGVLLCLLNDEVARTTSLVVLDAATMALQARLRLPRALPYGFHGDWEPECRV